MEAHDARGAHAASPHAVAEKAEARWAWIVGAVIAFLLVMMAYMSLHWISMPATRTETIDPTTLHLAGEFVERNLGTAREADGKLTLRVVANQYSFTPQCILVPADTPVLIRATSADVVHGFSVTGTNVNTMLVPGYVSSFEARFHKTGDFLMPCHEYCGTGHAAMWAHVKVVPQAEFDQALSRAAAGRASCVER
ncbi:cytochrome C oxidase subunit II [Massilia arenosa]|uniref:Cytochrome C oxidase subunit II n=1 Tax=Zemynaea arenosa TaxID=2561931 RepID=A0A4Y9S4B9_9BURK|nr:cytochrome C oxidase subunit II [Massilia arenosa]TFW14856.1 cytochrome C oxidase subunit II [Massilia arenosa]